MGCRCNERGQALTRAVSSAIRGQVKAVTRELGFVGKTAVDDLRSGAMRQAATAKLAAMRLIRR